MTPAMELFGVSVGYGDDLALAGIDLSIGPGEIVAVVGPSGSGKTTLLRAIAGLEPLRAGIVRMDGRDVADTPTHRRELGLMFQEPALFPHLDVSENVGFGLRMQHWAEVTRQARVEELLDVVGLDGFGRRAVHQLSGGEAQRVALARALAPSPRLLLLDEPLGSLDRVLRDELTDELAGLLRRLGQAAVHVTHDQAEAFALADRVVIIDRGEVVQVGEPTAVWGRPVTSAVARFLGHPNVWDVVVGEGGEVTWAGLELGVLRDVAAGSHRLLVPVTAVRLSSSGPLELTAAAVRFRDGRHSVSTEEPTRLVFETVEPVAPGERLRLRVDLGAARLVD